MRLLPIRKHSTVYQMLVWICLVLAFFMASRFVWVQASVADSSNVLKEQASVKEPEPVVSPTPIPPVSVLATPSGGLVQGAKTEEPASSAFYPVTITSSSSNLYQIYESPNLNSEVLEIAQEGEQFSVIDENSLWYNIDLGDGKTGWLLKSSVKNAQSTRLE